MGNSASEDEDVCSQVEVKHVNEEDSPILTVEEVGTGHQDVKDMRCDLFLWREEMGDILKELCSILRGYTVLLRSEGEIANSQPEMLGVYRMVDSYSGRPVYKQDGGENYIYYSGASGSWMVGTVVGHNYGWLRNNSEKATNTRWVPDLGTGWEYRPLVRSMESLPSSWVSDDGTLRIEALTGGAS